ncbi:MAG: TonB-dependent receptor [Sphingomonas sp.]|jgi:iron complex outermembrane receptor protein
MPAYWRAVRGTARAMMIATCSTLALGWVGGAQAQTAAPATDRATGQNAQAAQVDGGRVDDIVVTARRRNESLQDVPVAVSAFSASRLDELQAKDLSGIQYSTPNLYLNQGDASNAVIYIRGIGQNDSLAFADPSIGVYVDDVFVARTQAAFLDLFNVERVEVLRGPQGTLYGRNTIGGAIKFVSKRPPKQLDGYLEAGYGNYNTFSLKGRVGGPLAGDVLRGNIAFAFDRRDGYNFNSFTGRRDGDVRSYAGRASLLFTPTDRLEFLLSGDVKVDRPDTSRSPVRQTPITVAAASGLVTFPAATNPYVVSTNANGLSDQDGYGVSLTANFTVSDAVTLSSISAYRRFKFGLNLDTDGSQAPVLDILLRQKENQFSQELRLNFDNHAGVTFTGGLYYFHDRDDTFSGVDNGAATIFGFPVTLFGFPSSSLADTVQITDSFAAFADATYAITPKLTVEAGLRYTSEDRSSRRDFENFFNPTVSVINNTPPFLAGIGAPGTRITGKVNFGAWTPKATVSFKPNKDVLLYAGASRGFKSGGFDGRATSDFGFTPFRPEYVWSYEGGAKTAWLGGRLTANAAIFYNDYTDIQVTSFGADPVTGVFVSRFTNAAKARTYGAELEVLAQPTRRLSFDVSVGYLNARYDTFDILVGGVVTDVSDRALVNAPRWNSSLGASYKVPLGGSLNGTFHIDGAYRGRVATEITDSPVLAQPGYALLNAFVELGTADGKWQLRAGVKNLTDHAVRTQGFNLADFPGVQVNFYGAPRTYDLRLSYRF